MGRPSKLTEKQWAEIARRLANGEKCRALAREYGLGEATIRERLSAQTSEIKRLAKQIVTAEQCIKAMPISAQITAQTIMDELRAVSLHLAGAAKHGAMTSHRLAVIANAQVDKIDDIDPMKSVEVLQGIAALTKTSNEASAIGMNLLNANRDRIKAGDMDNGKAQPVRVSVRVQDAGIPEPSP